MQLLLLKWPNLNVFMFRIDLNYGRSGLQNLFEKERKMALEFGKKKPMKINHRFLSKRLTSKIHKNLH